jgi:hypothetical protein
MMQQPSDLVERADQRSATHAGRDVKIRPDGTVKQRERGSMDASMIPKGKEQPTDGAYVPEHDHLDPDLEPKTGSQPHVKKDLSA